MIDAIQERADVAALPAAIRVGDADIPVWREPQPAEQVPDARILLTQFDDAPLYDPALVAAALAAENDPRFCDPPERFIRGGCGVKVRNLQAWPSPAAQLIHARAIHVASRALGRSTIYVDDTWGSIYRNGAYCMPHSHTRSVASIVYFLDPGDRDPDDPADGQFCIGDPRIPYCCPNEPGRMVRHFMPAVAAGKMIIFAGEYVHSVNPYHGRRPRITLSWNVTLEALPGRAREAA